jgi:hypothetical protein
MAAPDGRVVTAVNVDVYLEIMGPFVLDIKRTAVASAE